MTNCRGIFVEANFKNGTVEVFSEFGQFDKIYLIFCKSKFPVRRTEISHFEPGGKFDYGKTYKFSIHLVDYHLFVKFGVHMVAVVVEIPKFFIEEVEKFKIFVNDFFIFRLKTISFS